MSGSVFTPGSLEPNIFEKSKDELQQADSSDAPPDSSKAGGEVESTSAGSPSLGPLGSSIFSRRLNNPAAVIDSPETQLIHGSFQDPANIEEPSKPSDPSRPLGRSIFDKHRAAASSSETQKIDLPSSESTSSRLLGSSIFDKHRTAASEAQEIDPPSSKATPSNGLLGTRIFDPLPGETQEVSAKHQPHRPLGRSIFDKHKDKTADTQEIASQSQDSGLLGRSIFDRHETPETQNRPLGQGIDRHQSSATQTQAILQSIPDESLFNDEPSSHASSSSSSLNFDSSLMPTASHTAQPTAVKTSEGRQIYLHKKKKTAGSALASHESIDVSIRERNPGHELNKYDSRNQFGIPVYAFKAAFEREQKEREAQAINPATHKPAPAPKPTHSQRQKAKKNSGILLSEKYRPTSWFDLVGPEKTHRRMLRWLRQWGPLVFDAPLGEENSAKPEFGANNFRDILSRPQKKILLIHGPPGIGKTTVAHVIAAQAGYDVMEINASDERSGATVKDRIKSAVGSHRISATGNPVCIIADEIEGAAEGGFIRALVDLITTDARSVQSIERLVSRGGSAAGYESGKKMAPRAVLRKLGKQKRQQQNASNNENTRGRKPRGTNIDALLDNLLQRPIIAVCNDVYANSLRTLRPYAEVVAYRKVSPHTISDTLQKICQKEGYDVDNAELTRLAVDSECDLRSCLNTLQFGIDTNDKSTPALELGKKEGASKPKSNFQKDMSKSWSSVVMRVFQQLRGSGSSTLNNNSGLMSQYSSAKLFSKRDESTAVFHEIQACGEYDRITTGSFLAYPHMQYNDDMFRKPVEFGDWLHFHDRINNAVYGTNQQGAIAEYYGYTALAAHEMFGNINNNRGIPKFGASWTNGPKEKEAGKPPSTYSIMAEHEFYEKWKKNKELVTTIFKQAYTMTPEVLQSFSKEDFVTTLLPFLVSFVNPELPSPSGQSMRSVTSRQSTAMASMRDEQSAPDTLVMTSDEIRMHKIHHAMHIVLAFGLRYVLHDAESGDGRISTTGTVYILDPPIQEVAVFDEKVQLQVSAGKFTTRRQINTEIYKHRKLKMVASGGQEIEESSRRKRPNQDDEAGDAKKQKTSEEGDDEDEALRKAQKKMKASASGLFRYAFARIESKTSKPAETEDDSSSKRVLASGSDEKTRIWVQYHEGLSNAVRRNLTWEGMWT